jgi:hypothetical protein
MGDREAEKKAWEIEQAALIAHEINNAEGTDFVAEASQHEPADVVLVSRSGKLKSRNAQVVSIPLDVRFRDDKQTVRRVQDGLTVLLKERGMRHMLVGLVLAADAEMRGLRPALLEELADLVVREGHDENFTLLYNDIYDRSPQLAEMVHGIFVSHHPEAIKGVSVDIPAGCAVPQDGRWIEEAITKKVARYGGEQAVKDLMLIVGVAGFVDDEQVHAFQTAFAESNLPFAEIWINTPFHGTVSLKRRVEGI